MASDEHVRILKSGVANWNAWRSAHPEVSVDLDDANFEAETLTNANLSNVSLRRAKLQGANFSDADLSYADLTSADLRWILFDRQGTNLLRANLSHATLADANLSRASLRHADLTAAHLYQTDLIHADLFGATLSGSHWRQCFLGDTNLINVDLSAVSDLASCQHFGPSFVDIRTLELSGRLPLPFLEGCGLPPSLIEQLDSLLNRVDQFYSCFISYASHDREFVNQLHADLENKGVRCWFAAEDQQIGDAFSQRIDEAIRQHQKLLLVLSKHSLASQWVKKEVTLCLELERHEHRPILIPIALDDMGMNRKQVWGATLSPERHIGDFRRWRTHYYYKTGVERLLRDVTIPRVAPE